MKGPNQYGPVLFKFPLDFLLKLPGESNVLVTKSNPIHWKNGQAEDERWFLAPEELAKNIVFGNFDKMLVIRTPTERIEFADNELQVELDDPERPLSSGLDAYEYARNRLKEAASAGQIEVELERHKCKADCICIQKYSEYNQLYFDSLFT